jgi:hypothetical protein
MSSAMSRGNININQLEAAIITKTGNGFEVADNFGEIIGNYKDWSQVADVFRSQDFSEEYIAKRRADLDRNGSIQIR